MAKKPCKNHEFFTPVGSHPARVAPPRLFQAVVPVQLPHL